MAAPMKEADSNSGKVEDDALNLSSPSFDPLRALYSSRVLLPCPNIVPLNNIAEYVSFSEGKSRRHRQAQGLSDTVQRNTSREKLISRNDDKRSHHLQKSSSSHSATEMLHTTHKVTDEPKGKNDRDDSERKLPKQRRNVLTRMEGYRSGPLSFLQRCVQERLLVQVWIRSAVDLRGVCKGYIVAFDKHFNLAMIDVDELYRCPLWKEAQLRKENKREKRRVKQLKEQMAQLSVIDQPTTTTELYSQKKDSKEESENKVVSLPPNDEISSKTDLKQVPEKKDSISEVQSLEKIQILGKNQKDSSTVSECDQTQDKIAEKPQSSEKTPHLPSGQVEASSTEEDTTSLNEEDPTSLNEGEPPPSKSVSQFLERHVNQLFIRGDNVVSIMMLE
ncbi:U7 snRNA-associated Sm-like protein LSm11 [Saccostrea echinata]|uniref:U7 snRNA-associated Sm-like protein LSm11 n=1 Tax=Saccostrea echinata TaxID=191078 RepID=UPI002A812928|nr:U7 snRNA-associated Sm-like protein LSm11 [Saccostrea echinata]